MVKSAEKRTRKYEESVDGEQVGRAISAVKPLMVAQQKTYFPKIAMLEDKVKALCEAQGVSTLQVRDYINVGRKCFSIARKFTQATRDAEAQRIVDLWTNRGLNAVLASEVCNLTGCKTTGVAPPPPTIIDASLTMEKWRGQWHMSQLGCFGGNVMEMERLSYNKLYAVPYPNTRRRRYTKIGFASASKAVPPTDVRLGIYDSDGQGYPNNLLLEIDPITVEEAENYEADIDFTMEKQLYFLAILNETSLFEIFVAYAFLSIQGHETKEEQSGMVSTTFPYAPLPNPYPPLYDYHPHMWALALWLEENL